MTLRIGIVGLGGIARKVYLPLLCHTGDWRVAGAYSPGLEKARTLCDSYRIPCFNRLDDLARQSDAVFVHSSTASHFDVVSRLLSLGIHVYVDKPLAETLDQAEQLVALAEQQHCALMVGFNRRFAPLYRRLREQVGQPSSLRMDKHRADSIGPEPASFTLLDDYLHVVDTALWLAGEGQAVLSGGSLQTNEAGQMLYAEHHFMLGQSVITTSMHRQAGSQREMVTAISAGTLFHIEEMRLWRSESAGVITEFPVPAWQTILEQKGFQGAVTHFIQAVSNQTRPEVCGDRALAAQAWIERLQRA